MSLARAGKNMRKGELNIMKVNGIYNYDISYEKLNDAIKYLHNSKSIEYRISIDIQPMDSEYTEIKDDYELTLSEAAKELGLSESSPLRHAIRKGRFAKEDYRLVGKTYLIKSSAIERYSSQNKKKPDV